MRALRAANNGEDLVDCSARGFAMAPSLVAMSLVQYCQAFAIQRAPRAKVCIIEVSTFVALAVRLYRDGMAVSHDLTGVTGYPRGTG